MTERRGGGLRAALAWLAFPVVPVALENAYSGGLHTWVFGQRAPDPREWNGFTCLIELGPILGFGFLAGATFNLPDGPTGGRGGPRAWLSRRAVWVAAGPWSGFVVWVAIVTALTWASSVVDRFFPDGPPESAPATGDTATSRALFWSAVAFVTATLCYGWLIFAVAAVRRARRSGRAWESLRRGLCVAVAFAGSLFGSFWAVTEWWRNYFFDRRIVPVILIASGAVAAGGCGSPVSYGEVRRRELFRAMLLSWTFGLAICWRWWARPRPKPPS